MTKFYPEDQCVLETLKPLSDEWFHGYSQFDFTANSSYESGDDFSFSNDHVYIEQVFPLASEEDFYGIELVLMLNPELQHRLVSSALKYFYHVIFLLFFTHVREMFSCLFM